MSNISFNPLAWAIKPMYDKAIAEDELFAKVVKEKESRSEKPKSLSECAEYILGEAFDWASNHRYGNLGFAGLPDEEMVNLIKHYYDEENIEIKKVTNATAKVSKTAEKKEEKKKEEPKKAKIVKMESVGLFAQQDKKEKKEEADAFDLFAGLWGDDEEPKKETPKVEEVEEEEVEEVEVVDVDDDDLPL